MCIHQTSAETQVAIANGQDTVERIERNYRLCTSLLRLLLLLLWCLFLLWSRFGMLGPRLLMFGSRGPIANVEFGASAIGLFVVLSAFLRLAAFWFAHDVVWWFLVFGVEDVFFSSSTFEIGKVMAARHAQMIAMRERAAPAGPFGPRHPTSFLFYFLWSSRLQA
jgi:hypothetical protein